MTATSSVRLAKEEKALRCRTLAQFITDVTPEYDVPTHLGPLLGFFADVAAGMVRRAVVAVPPGHFKTETILHGCAWLLQKDPTYKIAFASYAADFAATKSALAKQIVQRAGGVALSGRDREDYWQTPQGGLFKAGGVRGQWTGDRFRLFVIDDPIKNREEAESPTVREKLHAALRSDIFTRQEYMGTSFLVVHTPWHPDDPGQRLVKRKTSPWPYIRLPAIDAAGKALDPVHWPLERLGEMREELTDYEWRGLYLCDPQARGGSVFGEATYCTRKDIPTDGVKTFVGYDMAYTEDTHADHSVMVVLLRDAKGTFYVTDVFRAQTEAPRFASAVRERLRAWGNPVGLWQLSGTEKGVASFIRDLGIRLATKPASRDKFVRAQPAAAKWQAGKILVPRDAPWAQSFVDEVTQFTGLGDKHDDQVDALAAAIESTKQGVWMA